MKALYRPLLITSLLLPTLIAGTAASASSLQKAKRDCAKIGHSVVIHNNGSFTCGSAKVSIHKASKIKKVTKAKARGGPTGIRFYFAAYNE